MKTNITNFLYKFFEIHKESEGYTDKLGYGTFQDERHIIWLAIIILLSIILYQYCKNNKKKGKKLVKVLLITMFTIRIIKQIVKSVVGSTLPYGRDLIPGQMCSILIYLLPLTVLCNWKKIKTPVYVLSMMGGFMTFLINDFFDSRFINVYVLEGIWAHTIIWLVPIMMIGLGEFKLEVKKIWQIIVTMLIMLAWATFLNKVLLKDYNSNFFYLERNMLPGNLGGKYFFGIYTIIFFLLLAIIYGIPVIYKKISKALIGDNKKLKKKITIITIVSIIMITQIITINITRNRTQKYNEEEKNINLAIITTMISNKSLDYTQENIQESLDSILGENKVKVEKALIGLKVKYLETGNTYNTINSKANIKAVVIKQKINTILKYILEIILIINLIIVIVLIYKNKREKNSIKNKVKKRK